MILCLETATTLCSVALCDSAGVISLRESNSSKSHASMLTVYIGEILKETGIKTIDLNAVAVSKGPGSIPDFASAYPLQRELHMHHPYL
jgi:tRNA threonylcarbamoyladenosine biosynthesis protein TsaB